MVTAIMGPVTTVVVMMVATTTSNSNIASEGDRLRITDTVTTVEVAVGEGIIPRHRTSATTTRLSSGAAGQEDDCGNAYDGNSQISNVTTGGSVIILSLSLSLSWGHSIQWMVEVLRQNALRHLAAKATIAQCRR